MNRRVGRATLKESDQPGHCRSDQTCRGEQMVKVRVEGNDKGIEHTSKETKTENRKQKQHQYHLVNNNNDDFFENVVLA